MRIKKKYCFLVYWIKSFGTAEARLSLKGAVKRGDK